MENSGKKNGSNEINCLTKTQNSIEPREKNIVILIQKILIIVGIAACFCYETCAAASNPKSSSSQG